MAKHSNVFIEYGDNVCHFTDAQEETFTDYINKIVEKLNDVPKIVNLLVCDAATIQDLNKNFRGKNKATDILSWAYDESGTFPMPGETEIWGDLALCVEVCNTQAQESGWDIDTEVIRLLVHGLTHLAGYDHQTPEDEKQMLQLEMELLATIGFDDIYNQVE